MTEDINVDYDDVIIRQWANQIRKMKINELKEAIRQHKMIVQGGANLCNSSLPQFIEDYGTTVDKLCELTAKLYILEHEN